MPRRKIMGNILWVVLVCVCFTPYSVLLEKCMYIDYRGRNESNTEFNCSESTICRKNFRISYIHYPPYSTAGLLQGMIKKCCGRCTKITKVAEYMNITEISFKAINSSDFILPFVGKSSAKTLYGYLFIPIVDVPNIIYFTPKHRTVMEELIVGCLRLYPMIILCLLMAVISGFVVWSVETWYNRKQFPRSFLSGVFEGFWYSFVSMTTVGYGDRIVKSIPARVFSVIWILVGIIMFGLLTSLFTAEIIKATEPHEHVMSGAKVGALKYRDYDATTIVKHGGIVKEMPSWNYYSDILLLIKQLRDEEIDGFVVDKYTLAYVRGYLEWKKNAIDFLVSKNKSRGESYEERREDIEFFQQFTYRTTKEYKGERLSYGVLVTNPDVYEFFRHAIKDNRLALETMVGSVMNEQFPKEQEDDIFSSSGKHYQETMRVVGGILGFISLFGLFYELHNHRNFFCKLLSRHTEFTPFLEGGGIRRETERISRAV